MELSNSKNHPKSTMKVDGRGLNVGGVADIDVVGAATLDGRVASVELTGSLHGAEAMKVKGTIGSASGPAGLRRAPLALEFASNDFDLGRLNVLKNLDGVLTGKVALTGSFARPMLKGDVRATKLRVGSVTYATASIVGTGSENNGDFELIATEDRGGSLRGEVKIVRRRISGSVEAKQLHFDVESELLPRLREVTGELDGKIQLAGTTRAPEAKGTLELTHGILKMASTATSYREASATLKLSGKKAELVRFKTLAGTGGVIEGTGSFELGRRAVERLQVNATLRRCPVQWDTFTGLADAAIAVESARLPSGGLQTKIALDKALVELSDDHGIEGLIKTAHLEDVKVQKAKPVAVANPISKGPKLGGGVAHEVLVTGPLTVRSSGVDFLASADLVLRLDTQNPLLTGTLTLSPQSKVKLFGATFEVERGRFDFARAAQPTIDFSLSRQDKGERIGVDLAGPFRQPTARFWSKPGQLAATHIAGRVTGQKVEKRGLVLKGLEQKAEGPLAQLVARALSQTAPDQPYTNLVK